MTRGSMRTPLRILGTIMILFAIPALVLKLPTIASVIGVLSYVGSDPGLMIGSIAAMIATDVLQLIGGFLAVRFSPAAGKSGLLFSAGVLLAAISGASLVLQLLANTFSANRQLLLVVGASLVLSLTFALLSFLNRRSYRR